MNISQYVLIYSALAAILSPLIDSGEISCSFETGTLVLQKKNMSYL
jgi:hypothetical protein